jgi:hypothetical protein
MNRAVRLEYGDRVRIRNRQIVGTVAGVFYHAGPGPDPNRDVVSIRRADGTTYADLVANVERETPAKED